MCSLKLRPPTLNEAQTINDWRNDSESRLYNLPIDLKKTLQRLREAGEDLSMQEHSEYCWIVELNGKPAGLVLIKNVDWKSKVAEIGYVMATENRGQGVGSKAVPMLVNKVFTESSLEKLIAYTKVGNDKSSRILDRLAFTLCEIPEGSRFTNDQWYCYQLTRGSWQENRNCAT